MRRWEKEKVGRWEGGRRRALRLRSGLSALLPARMAYRPEGGALRLFNTLVSKIGCEIPLLFAGRDKKD